MGIQQMSPPFSSSLKVKWNKTENTANEKHKISEPDMLLADESLPLTSETKSEQQNMEEH